MVEEKKRLIKKLTKFSLQADERDSYPDLSAGRYNPVTGQQQQQQSVNAGAQSQIYAHQLPPQPQSQHSVTSNAAPSLSHNPHYLHLLQQQAQFAQQTLILQQQHVQQQHSQQSSSQYSPYLAQPQTAPSQSQSHQALNNSHHQYISPHSSSEHLSSYLHHKPSTYNDNNTNTSFTASNSDHNPPRPSARSETHHTTSLSVDILGLQESAIQSELSVLDSEIGMQTVDY